MLEPGNQAQQRLGLTPAKAPPMNFKNADKLEFFEVGVRCLTSMPVPHLVYSGRQWSEVIPDEGVGEEGERWREARTWRCSTHSRGGRNGAASKENEPLHQEKQPWPGGSNTPHDRPSPPTSSAISTKSPEL